MIDSHCHLADQVFANEIEAVVGRARAAGVERALVVLAAGDTGEAERAASVQALWPDVRVSVGVHPHTAHQFAGDAGRAAAVVRAQVAATPSARAVGEIGLDYHYDFSPRDVQQQVFRVQVRLAAELGLPVVVHTREADADTEAILREEGQGAVRGVLHCFTGGPALARAGLDLGLLVSFSGIVTFPKAGELRAAARTIPIERLLVETDSPYLAPVPCRGKRNEPAFLGHVVSALAEIHRVDAAEMARQTRANFHALFRP